jgi:hypothetical protein
MAGTGGKRSGAGRKPGVPNKRTAEKLAEIEASGETPLDYMLRVMRDAAQDHDRRDDMAKSAAPYVHAKLASVDANVKANVDGSISFTWKPIADD